MKRMSMNYAKKAMADITVHAENEDSVARFEVLG